jgi:hypothetical protein
MSEREHGTAPHNEAVTGESAAPPVHQEPPAQLEPSAQPAPQRTRISNLSQWIDRNRQLHYAGTLAPQDRYPGPIAAP